MLLNERTTQALLAKFGITFAQPEAEIAPGSDFTIEGRLDDGRRMLGVRAAAHAAERLLPLGDAGAGVLVDGLRAHGHHLRGAAARNMLVHLLIRASALFERARLDAMTLDVRLHENQYVVRHAALAAPAAVHVVPRLEHHGREGNGFRPSGMQ